MDNSKNQITTLFQNVIWIANLQNEGFGRANNLGASMAKGEYLLFLNSDMFLLENTITICLDYLKVNTAIGVLGCKLLNEDGTPQKSVYHYIGDYMGTLKNNLLIDYIFRPKQKKIKGVMGAFMIISKKVFTQVNGFDPDFFMYAEELDLCRRVENAGFKIEYLETATAIHKHGGSLTNTNTGLKQRYLSNALLEFKVKGILGYIIFHFLCYFNFITNLLLLWKTDKDYRKDFFLNQKMYFSNFIGYIKIPFLYSTTMGKGKRILRIS